MDGIPPSTLPLRRLAPPRPESQSQPVHWTALDQEIIETVLLTNAAASATASTAAPASGGAASAASALHVVSSLSRATSPPVAATASTSASTTSRTMFPSSRPPPLVSPLTAMTTTAAPSELPASSHSYHPQHPVLGAMQAQPPAYSTGYHDSMLPPAFVAPLTMASSASYQQQHQHHALDKAQQYHFATSFTDDGAPPKKPKRKRKYTDATRAKHREVQRRFILRKKERMQQEKQLAVELEKKVQLLQLLSETRSLELEQVELVQQCIAHGVDLNWHQIASYLEDDARAIATSFQPLRAGEWHGIVRETMHYIESFRPNDAFLEPPTVIGGWGQQSRIEHSTLSFRYSKALVETPGTTDELVSRVWHALTSSSSSAKIFGGGLVIKSKVLQVINDDTVVLFRAVFHPSTKEILRSVELVSRVVRGWEQLILLQSLEGLNIQSLPGRQSGWLRGVTWCKLTPESGESGVAIEWTGCVGQCAEDKLQLWRRELPVMIARFETMIVSADVCVAFNDDSSSVIEQPTTLSQNAIQATTSGVTSRLPAEELERKGEPQESDGFEDDGDEDDDDEGEGEGEEGGGMRYRFDAEEGNHGSDDSGSTCSESSATSA